MNLTTEQKAKELLESLESHPMAQEIRQKKAAEVLEQRRAWSLEIQVLESEKAEKLYELSGMRAEMEERMRIAKVCLEDAERKVSLAYHEEQAFAHKAGIALQHLRGELHESADPRIDEGIQFFRDEHGRLRSVTPAKYGHSEGLDLVRLEKKVTIGSTYPAIVRRMEHCRQAIQALEDQKMMVEYDPAIFDRLKAGLPALDEYTEFSGSRPTLRNVSDLIRAKIDAALHDPDLPGFMQKIGEMIRRPAPRACAKPATMFEAPERPAKRGPDPEHRAAGMAAHEAANVKFQRCC